MAVDLSSILIRLSSSIDPVTHIVGGVSYLIGFLLIWTSLKKLKAVADVRARYGGGGQIFPPLCYMFGGFMLFFLPTVIEVGRNTFFGSGSPIAYGSLLNLLGKYGQAVYVIIRLIELAGLIWFVRGTVLLVQASEPGVQHGPKGLAFLIVGVLAINIQYTTGIIDKIIKYIVSDPSI